MKNSELFDLLQANPKGELIIKYDLDPPVYAAVEMDDIEIHPMSGSLIICTEIPDQNLKTQAR